MPYDGPYKFLGFQKGLVGKFLRKVEKFDGWEVCHFFCQDSGSVLCVSELKAAVDDAFDVFLQL
jgi:hypothetical protein